MTDGKRNKRKEARQRNYKYIKQIKKEGECFLCLIKDKECKLTFHHREPKKKKKEVQRIASMGLSLRRLKSEIEKCDLLCEECHKFVHLSRTNNLKKYNKFIEFLKKKND